MQKTPETYYIPLLGMVVGTILLSFILGRHWIAWISFGIGFTGLAFPFIGTRFVRGVIWVQHRIGKLINIILLGSVFFLVLTPLAMFRKLIRGKDKSDRARESHYTIVQKKFTAADFKRPW